MSAFKWMIFKSKGYTLQSQNGNASYISDEADEIELIYP